jgi:hypothetical protein
MIGTLYSNGIAPPESTQKEDIDSLYRHLKEKRPHLLAALTSCVNIEDVLLETGRIPDGAGLDDFVERERSLGSRPGRSRSGQLYLGFNGMEMA